MQKNGQTYLKYLPVFTTQYFNDMFDHFSTLRRKVLNYNFKSILKESSQLFFCETLTLRNVETLQSIACRPILPENTSPGHT